MKSMKVLRLLLVLVLLVFLVQPVLAQQGKTRAEAETRKYPPLPDDVERKQVVIWSDGTRMAGDVYLPKDLKPEEKLPAVVFISGTGGTKKGTPARMAPLFVRGGYVFLAFDYRGWGESDSKLQMLDSMPVPDEKGQVTITGRAIRWQMDFADQAEDIRNAIAFIGGEPNIDGKRIGVIGTSYGGGLATWIAANDPRVRCAVAQVPGMGARGAQAEQRAFALQTQQARGEVEPVPFDSGAPGGKMASYAHMRYNIAKGIGFNAIEAAEKVKVPMLIIDAENEELMDTSKNGKRVAEILSANGTPVTYHVMTGISHYGIYREKFQEATEMEIEFFDEHLKP
jgi:dipeptidyl aminopeptidase/acylaminoacyl peptidase